MPDYAVCTYISCRIVGEVALLKSKRLIFGQAANSPYIGLIFV